MNQEEPIQYVLSRDDMEITTDNWLWYNMKLHEVEVDTDRSLFPFFSNKEAIKGFRSEPFKKMGWTIANPQATTDLWIERNQLT